MAGIKGLKELQRKLKNFGKEAEAAGKAAINSAVDKMITDAKANAPQDLYNLVNSIDKENRDNGWTVVFFVGEAHGAFQEFGTGVRAEIPAELASEALKFKGYKSGNFEDFLAEIKAWCSRKGIDPEAAWPIAVTILNKGLSPQPYFYPAYLKYRDTIMPDLKQRIKNLWR